MKLSTEWGTWIGNQQWDYIVTLRSKKPISSKSLSRVCSKVIDKDKNIETVFYVCERDSINPSNTHSHLLINTKDTNTTSTLFKRLEKNYTLWYEEVNDTQSVGYYITKWIDKDVEYDYINRKESN
jgi:hypothetical protein